MTYLLWMYDEAFARKELTLVFAHKQASHFKRQLNIKTLLSRMHAQSVQVEAAAAR